MVSGTQQGVKEFSRFLSQALDNVSNKYSQQEIGYALGWTSPSILSTLKAGRAKVPLDKIAPLSRYLGVDRSRLFRMALAQYYEGEALANIAECLNELPDDEEKLLRKYRLLKDKAGASSKVDLDEVLNALAESKEASV
ncbi:transcriptional regulator with XRE-family HTH domain [Ochrobactrum sp. P20RRXII]|nr:hypothetical protein [Ochrobactrum sp. P20RRXII]NIH77456.1 transcriptional regulator with XRE-family HTH domain [Ochrobactrum sp. P20RRXII]